MVETPPILPKILVTGATGYIGGRLVPALQRENFPVRVMARDPRKLQRKRWKNVEIFQGDVFDEDSLLKALEGTQVAYYLIHSMITSRREYAEKDVLAARNFAMAAEMVGLERIIYLGGLGDEQANLSNHLRSRHETGAALRSGTVPVTELRAAIIVGSGSASFEIIRDLSRRLRIIVCPRWVQSLCEPISIRQVLAYLIGVLREPRTIGEILEIGGNEVLTYADLMHQCAEVMGKKMYIYSVPVLTPRLSSYWLNLVTSVPMSLTRPLVEGLRNDVVCRDHRIREWIQVAPMTYREAVRLALDKEESGTRETRWTDATQSTENEVDWEDPTLLEDIREIQSQACPTTIFTIVQALGGETGWLYGDWVWQLRGAMDWLLGGVGMRRGRRHPTDLAVGEPVDFWRVEELLPGEILVLKAEMKLPGVARLEFQVFPGPDGKGAFFRQVAHFWPKGLSGWLYWYVLLPIHYFIFAGMARNIVKKAEHTES
jgi:uncharacterized protein YbjT (DUF2867 family)